ncbi:hypothetical protein FOCG_06483 [Fusarium oxysporum f. sp. radicis-lycopersici 26381]|uniref:Uncharacterized protein n=1 Tax=Fusarium oxysporum Fo47 TaxID=660027 RepID=W9L086_FUSOX|nr:hypothetical protein FOZG_03543 [Fusarium oxysporum Fo47]EWZ92755.1 hypothetical protein FOWG_05783 [Fusarium oxysporum f. sp. lycopersici MN25]EXL53034.1 hypothetical protein FOCG_06483 [Fusarium oxysporum f. sp. radicis-lycopersici 26381]KAJ0145112.1 hypothetical protein HZ326_12136 [Fusarium oxysporum f. sp. albedinis]EWZ47705.1 hypothetical protein FOZG_03543 [Fusarium oxysporum Fo47]
MVPSVQSWVQASLEHHKESISMWLRWTTVNLFLTVQCIKLLMHVHGDTYSWPQSLLGSFVSMWFNLLSDRGPAINHAARLKRRSIGFDSSSRHSYRGVQDHHATTQFRLFALVAVISIVHFLTRDLSR